MLVDDGRRERNSRHCSPAQHRSPLRTGCEACNDFGVRDAGLAAVEGTHDGLGGPFFYVASVAGVPEPAFKFDDDTTAELRWGPR
jgi:hypothetical protein